jgi:peptide/nickel transport system substrate-binding protein
MAFVAPRRIRLVLLTLAVAAVVAIASGCGGSSAKTAPEVSDTGATVLRDAPFPVFKMTVDTGLDSLDPGVAHTAEAWQSLWNIYLTLVGYRHANGQGGATLVPVLAKALPVVSADGKTYTLTLRPGRRYSNGAAVKASDFPATIERDFRMSSSGADLFTDIVGADAFLRGKSAHISGIHAEDSTGAITIHLVKPRADFANILASIFAAPLPAGTPARDLSAHPPPSTGPYRIASYHPGRQIVILRNPHYTSLEPSVPDGNPNKVIVSVVPDDVVRLDGTIGGRYDYDYPPIPFDRLERVADKYDTRLRVYTGANTYYFFMNTRVKPFDDIRVRKAVNYAIDRQALVREFGGLAQATQNVLPPTADQYRRLDLYGYDIDKAKQLIAAAHAKGTHVVVWGSNRPASLKPVDYLVKQLRLIGLVPVKKIVDGTSYWAQIGNQRNHAAIGFADWFQNYPHPLDWFGRLLIGSAISRRGNENYANANVPAVNNLTASLAKRPKLTPAVNAEWATLDRLAIEEALWAPFVNRNFTAFFSKRVDPKCVVVHVVYDFDWSTVCETG